jgi:hypothetical protein
MRESKHEPCQIPRVRIVNNLVDEVIGALQLPKGPHTVYDNRDVLRVLFYAIIEHTEIENAANLLRSSFPKTPSPDVVLERLSRLTEMEVFSLCQVLLAKNLKRRKVQRLLKKGPLTVAIDEHQIPTWSKSGSPYIIGSALHEGTRTAYSLLSLEIVSDDLRLTLAIVPITRLACREELILNLLKQATQYICIKIVLMDRGFWSARILDDIDKAGFHYLIPVPRSEPIDKVLQEIKHLMQWVSPWSITSTDKKRTAQFTLTVQDTPRKKRQRSIESRLLLATNQKINEDELLGLAQEYDGRWGIETGYRVKEHDFRIRTRTRRIATRLFLWILQFIVYNLWILARMIQEKRDPMAMISLITTGQFRLKLLLVLGIVRPNR